MTTQMLYRLAADGILFLHGLFVAFVVCGQVFIVIGWVRHWRWVRNPWFRGLHLLAIAIVAVQAWFSIVCPLTTWEMALRSRAGDSVYAGAFIAHWLQEVLYYDLPPWVFVVCYTAFAALVVASWIALPPRRVGEQDRRH